jgi:hypothetical protein
MLHSSSGGIPTILDIHIGCHGRIYFTDPISMIYRCSASSIVNIPIRHGHIRVCIRIVFAYKLGKVRFCLVEVESA